MIRVLFPIFLGVFASSENAGDTIVDCGQGLDRAGPTGREQYNLLAARPQQSQSIDRGKAPLMTPYSVSREPHKTSSALKRESGHRSGDAILANWDYSSAAAFRCLRLACQWMT
jgi:hypothetical protein